MIGQYPNRALGAKVTSGKGSAKKSGEVIKMIKYRTFAWGPTVHHIESGKNVLLDQVESFVNKIGEDNVISITGHLNAIIVWYKE